MTAEIPPHQHPAVLWSQSILPAPPRVVVLHGAEEYFARVEVDALAAALSEAARKDGQDPWSFVFHDWASPSAKEMTEAALPLLRRDDPPAPPSDSPWGAAPDEGGGGLFSMLEAAAALRTCHVVWGAEAWPSKRAKEFEAWIRAHSDNDGSALGDVLVLYYRGKSGPPSWLKPSLPVIKCTPLRSWEVPEWLSWRAQHAHRLKLDPKIARWVASQCGEELAVLDQDLRKLSVWVRTPERAAAEPGVLPTTVAPQDANRSFVPHQDMGPWLLLEAWGKRQAPLALKLLNKILSAPTGDPCMGLTVAIQGHLVKLIQARALWETRSSAARGTPPTASELEALFEAGGVGKGRSQRESWLAQVRERDLSRLTEALNLMAEEVEVPIRRGAPGPSRMRWWLYRTLT